MLKQIALSGLFGIGLCTGAAIWAYGLIHASFMFQTGGTVVYLAASSLGFGMVARMIR
jgi:hypothetical protein